MRVLLSIWPSVSQPFADVLDVATYADSTGWHGLYIEDHFMADGAEFGEATDPRLECTSVLASIAAATSSLRLAPLVLSATFRHPAVVANWAATVDHISNGRLTLGVGAGWQQNEHEQYGIVLGERKDRLQRLAEYVEIVRSLTREPMTNFSGDFFTLRDAWCEPSPLQDPLPILIGGKGDRMMSLVARWADQWNMWAMPDVFFERSSFLNQSCEVIGRDPSQIHRSTQALVLLTNDVAAAESFRKAMSPRPTFAGTAAQFAELVNEWKNVGVDEVIVPDWYLGTGQKRKDAMDELFGVVASMK